MQVILEATIVAVQFLALLDVVSNSPLFLIPAPPLVELYHVTWRHQAFCLTLLLIVCTWRSYYYDTSHDQSRAPTHPSKCQTSELRQRHKQETPTSTRDARYSTC